MELTISIPQTVDPVEVFGAAERHLKLLRDHLNIVVMARGDQIKLRGEGHAVNRAAELLAELTEQAERHKPMSFEQLTAMLERLSPINDSGTPVEPWQDGEPLEVYMPGKRIRAKSRGQQAYLQAIRTHDMVFCTGPAGTGKTYLAVAAAVSMLKKGLTRKLVLVRPAVEAGEKLGFLPGDMQDKVNPYLRPLLDGLNDMMPFDQTQRFMQSDLIEIVPLAFMRGRTLNDAVIIMDEAQNTTISQMLMFLTRLGHHGKMIVTGDTSQTDLPSGVTSGLTDAARRLRRVPGVAFVALDRCDIVRHQLVQRIVEAYGQES